MKKYLIEIQDDKMDLLKGLKREFKVSSISDVIAILAGTFSIQEEAIKERDVEIKRLRASQDRLLDLLTEKEVRP